MSTNNHHNSNLTPAQQVIENKLTSLSPVTSDSCDQLIFDAGCAAAQRSITRYRYSTAVLLLALVFSCSFNFISKTPTLPGRSNQYLAVNDNHKNTAPITIQTVNQRLAENSYIVMRNKVLTSGLSVLETPKPQSASPIIKVSKEQLLNDLLQ